MILTSVNKTKAHVKCNHPITNDFLRTMKEKNIPVCRISTNYYRVDHPCLPAMFHFGPFGRVAIQPVLRSSTKDFFFRAEVTVSDLSELFKKCVKLGFLNKKDHDRYFA